MIFRKRILHIAYRFWCFCRRSQSIPCSDRLHGKAGMQESYPAVCPSGHSAEFVIQQAKRYFSHILGGVSSDIPPKRYTSLTILSLTLPFLLPKWMKLDNTLE